MWDLFITFFILASGIVANKYVLLSMPPDLLVGIRMGISGLLILLWSGYHSPRLRWRYIKHDAGTLLFIIFCTTLIPALLKAYALTSMPASKQTLLGSIDPFVTALYMYLLFGERIGWYKFLGMLIGCCGIAVAVSGSLPLEQRWGEWLSISLPEGAVFLAIALGRYGWILLQGLLKKERYRPHEVTGMSMLVSGCCALIINWMRGGAFVFPHADAWRFVTALWYTTFIGNIIGYVAYGYCLSHHHAVTIAMVGVSMPLLVAGIGCALGLDAFSWRLSLAAGLVAIGMVFFYYEERKKRQSVLHKSVE